MDGAYRRTVLGGEDFMAKMEKIIAENKDEQQLNEFHGLISGIRAIQDPRALLNSVAEVFQIPVDRSDPLFLYRWLQPRTLVNLGRLLIRNGLFN